MANNELSRISSDIYKQVNAIIGDEAIVNIRRTTTNLRDNVYKRMCEVHDIRLQACYSGSKAEGFRFKSSDEDWMLLCRHIKVIPSSSCALLYDSNTTLLLMENEMTKPGFALLRPLTDSSDRFIEFSTQALLNDYYISSKLWRDAHTAAHGDASMVYTHGPCTSGEIGECEFDFAICLRNDIWPTNAQDCIRRLQQLWMAVTCYHPRNSERWRSLCANRSKAIVLWKHGVEDVFLPCWKEAHTCHESYTVSVLRTFKVVLEGSNRCQRHCQRTFVFVFPENRCFLGNFYIPKPMDSVYFLVTFLELFYKTFTVD